MEIVDAQIHEPLPPRPLDDRYGVDVQHLVNVEIAREAMDSVGVDVALLFASQEYINACIARYPDRFGGAPSLDYMAEDLEDQVAKLRRQPGYVAMRCHPVDVMTLEPHPFFLEGKLERLFTYAEKHDVPLFVSAHGSPHLFEPTAQAHPGLTMIIDHLGVSQSPVSPLRPEPWDQLPRLLGLAKYPNVHVKFSGAPAMSTEAYPFKDVWPYLHQIIDAFGPERLMWGSDYTRMRQEVFTLPMVWPRKLLPRDQWKIYGDCVNYLRDTNEISQADKEQMFSKTIRRVLRWEQLPAVQPWPG